MNNAVVIAGIVVVVLLVFNRVVNGESFRGKVTYVSDGDTLTVQKQRKRVQVRIWGIDAPEIGQRYGQAALGHAMDIALNQRVKVTVVGKSYGRIVGHVSLGTGAATPDFGNEMVRAGLAWWSQKYAPKARRLEQSHREAKTNRLGLWRDPRPIAPWAWRGKN